MHKVKQILILQITMLVVVCGRAGGFTRVTPSSYIVSNIEVATREEERSKAEQELFVQAKERALSFIKLYLNKESVDTKDVNIDSLMIEFTPVKIKHEGHLGTTGIFEVVFDKSLIDSLLAISKITDATEVGISFRVLLKKGPVDWLVLKRYFFKNGMDYRITVFGADFIQGEVLKISKEEMVRKLNLGNFEVIQNNSLHFIKSNGQNG